MGDQPCEYGVSIHNQRLTPTDGLPKCLTLTNTAARSRRSNSEIVFALDTLQSYLCSFSAYSDQKIVSSGT
jgi:hypothetical protein